VYLNKISFVSKCNVYRSINDECGCNHHSSFLPSFYGTTDLLRGIIGHRSDTRHLFQMLGGMIGMNHRVLNSDIISTKEKDGFTSWVVKVLDVINHSINSNFSSSQTFQGCNLICWFSRSIDWLRLALPQLVCIGGHVATRIQLNLRNVRSVPTTLQQTRTFLSVVEPRRRRKRPRWKNNTGRGKNERLQPKSLYLFYAAAAQLDDESAEN
jgi:hypothetical protein